MPVRPPGTCRPNGEGPRTPVEEPQRRTVAPWRLRRCRRGALGRPRAAGWHDSGPDSLGSAWRGPHHPVPAHLRHRLMASPYVASYRSDTSSRAGAFAASSPRERQFAASWSWTRSSNIAFARPPVGRSVRECRPQDLQCPRVVSAHRGQPGRQWRWVERCWPHDLAGEALGGPEALG